MTRSDEICFGGYQGHDQLAQADSLAGELRQDPLDARYSPPDREPPGLRIGVTDAEIWAGESLAQRSAEEDPDLSDDSQAIEDFDWRVPQERAGRLVAPDAGGLLDDEATEIATDAGRAGWGASAEEAAVHILGRSENGGNGSWPAEQDPRADDFG